MAAHVMATLLQRQTAADGANNNDVPFGFVEQNGRIVPFWYSRTGEIIKWSIFLGFTVLFGGYLILGYMHAKRRLNKGLKPMAYHRWLVSRQQMATVDPAYAYPQSTYTNYRPGYYNMQPMPPPVYDPNSARPPHYEPPEGATKADPSQWRSEPTRRPAEQESGVDDFAPPAGPPPPAVTANHTGASNNPYRP